MASLTLSKGHNLSLSKADPSLSRAVVGLGWDPRTTAGQAFDLDASALLLGVDGKVRSQDDFIFYNQLATPTGRSPTWATTARARATATTSRSASTSRCCPPTSTASSSA